MVLSPVHHHETNRPQVPNLTRLDLSGMPSAAFMPPGNLMDIQALEELDMSQTGLMAFPMDALSMGASLRVLKLAGNKISNVPDQVSCMWPHSKLLSSYVRNENPTPVPHWG